MSRPHFLGIPDLESEGANCKVNEILLNAIKYYKKFKLNTDCHKRPSHDLDIQIEQSELLYSKSFEKRNRR